MTKVRFTSHLSPEIIERAKDAAYATGTPLAQLVQRAISREIVRLEGQRGKAFRPRRGNLPIGRPPRVPS